MVENLCVKPESPVGHSNLTLVDILVTFTHLTLENGSSKCSHLFNMIDLTQIIPLDMIVPEAMVNYVVAISGVTPSECKETHSHC